MAPDPPPRFLSSATRVMSQSSGDEDLAGLADATQDNVEDQEMGSPVPSSPELICNGCRKSSKSKDPIAKKRKSDTEATRGWGKTTTRKVRSFSGRERKVIRKAGSWCRYCQNCLSRWSKRGKYLRMMKNGVKTKLVLKAVKDDVLKSEENGSTS